MWSTHLFQWCGFRRALRLVTLWRDQHPIQLEQAESKPVQFILRGLLMMVAGLQAVKLFALKGIPLTQFFGACFLPSYIVNALLNVFGKPVPELDAEQTAMPTRDNAWPSKEFLATFATLSAKAQSALWAALLKPVLDKTLYTGDLEELSICIILLHFPAIALVGLPITYVAAVHTVVCRRSEPPDKNESHPNNFGKSIYHI